MSRRTSRIFFGLLWVLAIGLFAWPIWIMVGCAAAPSGVTPKPAATHHYETMPKVLDFLDTDDNPPLELIDFLEARS